MEEVICADSVICSTPQAYVQHLVKPCASARQNVRVPIEKLEADSCRIQLKPQSNDL